MFPSVGVVFNFIHQHLKSFQSTCLLASFGRFIPRYFILFDVMANEIVSLISLSDILLVVCISAQISVC